MTRFFVTIDTEHFTQAPSPVVPYPGGAWCTVGGRHCGFPLIMDICDRFAIKATFFVNVFEYQSIGQGTMIRMCEEILQRGHDVQLHTHPAFLTGRSMLCDHSLNQQRELIELGIRKLHEWTGRKVVAHRAGYYGVNANSLTALKDSGITLDCSSFYRREGCRIQWSRFELAERDIMWELPISWFSMSNDLRSGDVIRDGKRICKVDIDKASADCLIEFLRQAVDEEYGQVTLASHSFSFVQSKNGCNGYGIDEQKIEEFRRLLEFVASTEKLQTQTVAELWEDIRNARVLIKPDGKEICLQNVK
jgi:hypothetical protein